MKQNCVQQSDDYAQLKRRVVAAWSLLSNKAMRCLQKGLEAFVDVVCAGEDVNAMLQENLRLLERAGALSMNSVFLLGHLSEMVDCIGVCLLVKQYENTYGLETSEKLSPSEGSSSQPANAPAAVCECTPGIRALYNRSSNPRVERGDNRAPGIRHSVEELLEPSVTNSSDVHDPHQEEVLHALHPTAREARTANRASGMALCSAGASSVHNLDPVSPLDVPVRDDQRRRQAMVEFLAGRMGTRYLCIGQVLPNITRAELDMWHLDNSKDLISKAYLVLETFLSRGDGDAYIEDKLVTYIERSGCHRLALDLRLWLARQDNTRTTTVTCC